MTMWKALRIGLITDPLAALAIACMGISSVLAYLLDRKGHASHRSTAFWSRVLLVTSGVKVRPEGLENIPRDRPLVLVANHGSLMDIPILMACVPISFRFLAKRSLFRLPFIGWHLRAGGHIGLEREDKRSAARALSEAVALLKSGGSVLIFAEGSRSGGELQAFKEGAAYLAMKAGVEALPLGLRGAGAILPRGSIHIRPGEVTLKAGPPLAVGGGARGDKEELTRLLRERVGELVGAAPDSVSGGREAVRDV